MFELTRGVAGVGPTVLALPPNSCPRVTQGRSIPTPPPPKAFTLCVHPAEDSNDKERGQCSKNDQ